MTDNDGTAPLFAVGDGRPRAATPGAEVRGDHYRITVLTSRLIRMEWSPTGEFVDAATAIVSNRAFPVPSFTVTRDGDAVAIRTDHLELHYDGHEFSSSGLSADLFGAPDIHYATWRYGQELPQTGPWRGNLGGTARTLDDVDGACALEPGILSTYGFAALDDSDSVIHTADGWVAARPGAGKDLYLFAHGRDYQGALDDYFALTGRPALLPRYVLGNWWSRYWRYDQQGYLDLVDGFAADRLPFSVAVLDMDWHVVDVDPELGTGWTGYTWNRELFPDPPQLLSDLHDRGLAVTLNVHPADGVRRHEDAYPDVARAVGVDPETGAAIPFDIASREFVDAYLTYLHRPLERDGVDFWWLDWQSGGLSRVKGLDPLWMLNHVHFTDSGREGHRPLTFSRYSGPGSHRYPVGFSGDTIATWDSLKFQPYFTSTAANIGYFWWSHDIGGHMGGVTDPELVARWMQFGALSPINRLHSSSSPFASKEPHLLGPEAGAAAADALRLRHVLVPYLYTAAWAAHRDGRALVRPLYHDHPHGLEAYEHTNTYMLGEDLLVAPITSPRCTESQVATATAWLPSGTWIDAFTGRAYAGNRTVSFHRALADYPLLARAGAVVPLQADALAPVGTNPSHLVLRAFPGEGTSVLVEDDGSNAPMPWTTQVRQTATANPDGTTDIAIELATEGPSAERRLARLGLDLAGIDTIREVSLHVGGEERAIEVGAADDDAGALLAPALRVSAADIDLHAHIVVRISGARARQHDDREALYQLLAAARIPVFLKDRALAACDRYSGLELVSELMGLGLPAVLMGALLEVLTGAEA